MEMVDLSDEETCHEVVEDVLELDWTTIDEKTNLRREMAEEKRRRWWSQRVMEMVDLSNQETCHWMVEEILTIVMTNM